MQYTEDVGDCGQLQPPCDGTVRPVDPGRLRVAANALKDDGFPGEEGGGEWTDEERESMARAVVVAYQSGRPCPTCKQALPAPAGEPFHG